MSEPVATPRASLPLRMRKKARTRRTIADAAFSLALDHGVDGVLVEQIAELAFVSQRTLSNYFPSKEAAIVASGEDDLVALREAILRRPEDEPPLTSLRRLLVDGVRAWTPEQLEMLRAKERLIDEHPSLVPFRMAQYDAFEDTVRIAIAERLSVNAGTTPHPRLLAGAAATIVKTAVRVWILQEGDEPDIAELVERGFANLAAGLKP